MCSLVFLTLWLSGDTCKLFMFWQWHLGNKPCCLTPDSSNAFLKWSHLPNSLYFGRGKTQAEQMNLRHLRMRDKFYKNCSRLTLHIWAQHGFFSRLSLHPFFQKGLEWPTTDLSPVCLSEMAMGFSLPEQIGYQLQTRSESGWHFLWLSLTKQMKLQEALSLYGLEAKMLALIPKDFVL